MLSMTRLLVQLSVRVRIEWKRKEGEEVLLIKIMHFYYGAISHVSICNSYELVGDSILIEFLSASFELIRKEQQKALQEKQKSKLEKHKTEDISVLLEENKEDRAFLDKNSEADGMTTQPFANSDLGKSSFPSQNPPARPRVPPGFKTTVLDKNSGSNLSHSRVTEVFTCT